MSRIGKRVLTIPENVNVDINEQKITVKGPKGELNLNLDPSIKVKNEEGQITVEVLNNTKQARKMHGTTNSLINNMIKGVTDGYKKSLEIVGVGYRFNLKGKKLTVQDGKSHLDEIEIPEGIEIKATSNTEIEISGIDKCSVGQFAAEIREFRKPEPYKGKGIRYKDEHVRRKEGKKAA